jgi:hypothetical protein
MHPKYWVFADPFIWEKPAEHFYPDFNIALEKAVDVKLFVPTGGARFFVQINAGPLIDLHFFHYDTAKDVQMLIDFTGGIPPFGQNVVIVSLMLAFFLGCNPIYFIGCDHDFLHFNREAYETSQVKHFYDNPGTYKDSDTLTWEQYQSAMARVNYQYEQLKLYVSLWGFDVYNATRGGYLDHFPRVEYETLFVPPIDFLERKGQQGYEAEAMNLAQNAVKLMNEGAVDSALKLLEAARCHNFNTRKKVNGLEYLMALCLSKLGAYDRAMLHAREDWTRNADNRGKSMLLIEQLERYV